MTDKIVLRTVPVIRVVRMGGGAGGGGAWGSITGTLSAQTDLQTALDAKQASDAELTALAGLASAADRLPYFTGSGTAALGTFTAFGRSLVDDADASAARTTLGLGTAATAATGDFDPAGAAAAAQAASQPLDGDLTAIAALSATGGWAKRTAANTWEISTPTASDVAADPAGSAAAAQAASQPVDAELTALAGLTSAADALPYFTGSGTAAVTTLSAFIRTLLDDADAATARATLGAGTGSGDALTTNSLAQFAATTSAELRGLMSDETGTGAAVFQGGDIGAATGTSLDVTGGKLSSTQAVAAASMDGLVLATSATATVGAQKWSPRFRQDGSGWKTDATAGAQAVSWISEVVPVQGTAAPSAQLTHSYSVNGGSYTPLFTVDSLRGRIFLGGTSSGIILDPATTSTFDIYMGGSTHAVRISGGISAFRGGLAASNPSGGANSPDAYFMRGAASNWVLTASVNLTANPPNAQTLSVQDASGTNIAGAAWTFRESRATGTAKGGGFQWYLGTTLGSGTTLQTAALALDLGVTTYHVLTFADAIDIAFNTTTGTKIGTATTQKLGFYGATPIAQGASVADATDAASAITQLNALISRIEALGLIATV